MAGWTSFLGGAAESSVCRLAVGVVAVAVGFASTYEYEVWVTTEMPPSGSVEVSVAVTRVEDGGAALSVMVAEALVLRVVPSWVVDEDETIVVICQRCILSVVLVCRYLVKTSSAAVRWPPKLRLFLGPSVKMSCTAKQRHPIGVSR